jgi:hypothetical protein
MSLEKLFSLIFGFILVASVACLLSATGLWIINGSVDAESVQSRLGEAGGIGLMICFLVGMIAIT